MFLSSTQSIPSSNKVPTHIAIIMDGNGRWAKKRFLPRVAGHVKGVESVREMVRACIGQGVKYLTLFAFSSENWRRPEEEVTLLMQLFVKALNNEVAKLHKHGVRLKIVGDLSRFSAELQSLIQNAESLTQDNTALTLTIAANYGGRWDIVNATNKAIKAKTDAEKEVTEEDIAEHLSMSYAPEPDLFIRTGGEERVSNFLLWQLAYAEFYFTDELWPDFDASSLQKAILSYQSRERRFGRTSEQLNK
ncbi:isoprenyl transferase [Leeia sp. TBRC 13508]|uniref:Isoprenyl transferase n=1 Tax=Leeia speluncae TaxID=2884804 RepID=A0ABS8D6J5_9NEIS|nr:isoprenyl transferase [Leeia speluncae]MCB6183596.1 isoprenyl transferase [Leeia speluncae]